MKNKKQFSMIQKLSAMTICMILGVGIINAIQFKGVTETVIHEQSENIFSNADALSSAIAAQIYERYGDVKAFTLNQKIYSKDNNEATQTLNTYTELYGLYDLIVVLDANGKLVAVNDKSPTGKKLNISPLYQYNFSNEEWFKNVLAEKYTEDKENGFTGTYVSNPFQSELIEKVYGEKLYNNIFATAVKNETGKITYIVANYTNFKWVEEELYNAYDKLKHSGFIRGEYTVLDNTGSIIAEYDPSVNGETYKRNYQVLNKVNLVQLGVGAVKELVAGKTGIMFSMHARKKIDQSVAYITIEEKKFVRALKWGLMVRVPKEDLLGGVKAAVNQFYIILLASVIACGLLAFYVIRKIGMRITTNVSDITESVSTAKKISNILNEMAAETSACSSEQASAIQESASALAEMTSMISQTTDNSNKSLETARNVSERSESGREIMSKMLHSMNAIEKANMSLQDISKIIQDINSKTGVINDIVFKTQLLSFNASIEAARAGQYGKGFAVVAEEVGNLAQMSGNAAKEIEALISDSQKQVGSTLDLIRQRVKEGNVVSDEAVRTFNEIATSVKQITDQVKNIAEAAEQQSVGIEQTQKAMNQLDIVARKNYEASQKSTEMVGDLNSTSAKLSNITDTLSLIVTGNVQNTENNVTENNVITESKSDTHKEPTIDSQVTNKADLKLIVNNNILNNGDEITADNESFKKVA